MEPRVFTRGNAISLRSGRIARRCFNGATRLHAWKSLPRPQLPVRSWCFNGATRLHAWKCYDSADFKTASDRFNGATRLHAWKYAWLFDALRSPRWLQWSHASSRVEI